MKLGYPISPVRSGQSRNIPADQASYVALAPGDTLDNRFLLTEQINHGGMATVFKAEDQLRQRQPVAVKVPHFKYASGIGAWSRFEREAEALVDRVVARAGADRLKLDSVRLNAEGSRLVAWEVLRVLEDAGRLRD